MTAEPSETAPERSTSPVLYPVSGPTTGLIRLKLFQDKALPHRCLPDDLPVSLDAATYGAPNLATLPLVILHGFLGSGGNWHTLARRFGERRRVLVPDARNHGRSPHAEPHGYAAMAADVAALLDAHGLNRAAVLGHSMGGKTAMHLALTHPERVERLVVVDAAPGRSPSAHAEVLEALGAVDLTIAATRADVEAALAARLGDAGLRGWLLKSLLRTPEGGFRWALNVPVLQAALPEVGGALEPTLPPGWRPFAGPTLFVRGGRSRYVSEADLPEIERLFPAAEVVTVPDAGHWVHAEQPGALARIVEAFLA